MSTGEALLRERCRNHPAREAVARCPPCQRFYCRECVTEHDDRLVCAACLEKLGASSARRRSGRRVLAAAVEGLLGLALAFGLFYTAGRFLAEIPTTFNEKPHEAEEER